jgi:predicted lipid-binding transport protein (Tim44 family)
MKRLITVAGLALVLVGSSMWSGDAEARRFGAGRSSGMQRDSATQRQATPAPSSPTGAPTQNPGQPAQAAAPAPGAAAAAPAAAPPKRSWLGPVAGLAAGLGLAALASHFGFGEGLANFLLIALAVLAVIVVFKLLFRRKTEPAMEYAGAGTGPLFGAPGATPSAGLQTSGSAAAGQAAAVAPPANIPTDFDVEGFLRTAKLNFVRLQAANDRGDLEDIRQFTSPEMFAEIRMEFEERGKSAQQTDVVTLQAELLEVSEEANRYVVSVRFGGLIREANDVAPTPFSEVWHLTKPKDGSRGWVVAGIQQVQ